MSAGNITEEKTISELIDWQSRSRIIILFNVPTRVLCHAPAHIYNCTSSYLTELFKVIDLPIQPIFVCRLGNVSNKPRPLRIVQPIHSAVLDILKVKRNLHNAINFRSISISYD